MIFRGAMSFVMSVCVIEPYGIAERQGAQRMSRGLPLMQNQLHGDVVSFSKCSFEFVLLLSRAVTWNSAGILWVVTLRDTTLSWILLLFFLSLLSSSFPAGCTVGDVFVYKRFPHHPPPLTLHFILLQNSYSSATCTDHRRIPFSENYSALDWARVGFVVSLPGGSDWPARSSR